MIRKLIAFIVTFSVGWVHPALGAEFKPIVLNPKYNHDKFVTTPRDLFREFRAYVTSFDSSDDDNGD